MWEVIVVFMLNSILKSKLYCKARSFVHQIPLLCLLGDKMLEFDSVVARGPL